MDKDFSEEKIQWMKKFLQKKESISSVCQKKEFIIRPLINGLEIIKQLEAFFEKGIPIELLPKKKPVFDYLSEKVLSGISVPAQISDAQILRKMDFEV